MKKIMVIIAGVLVFAIIVSILAWIFFFSPEASSRSTAVRFFEYVINQKPNEAKQISSLSDDQVAAFSREVSYRTYKVGAVSHQEPSYYVMIDFTGGESPRKARIGVTNQIVSSVTTGDNLALTPAGDPEERKTDKKDLGDTCLSDTDLAFIDARDLYAHKIRAGTMIFRSAKTVYATQSLADQLLQRLEDFYKRADDKDWSIEVRGYMVDDDSKVTDEVRSLLQNRAQKIRDDLTKRGVAEDRIYVEEPQRYSGSGSYDDGRGDIRQYDDFVDMLVVNNCRDS